MFNYDRLNALVKETGIKKAHINRLLGDNPYYLRDAEKNKRDISGRALRIIADALDTTPEYLTGKSDEKKPTPEGELDSELADFLQDLRDRPEMRMLFSLTHSATKEDVERAVKIIEALR